MWRERARMARSEGQVVVAVAVAEVVEVVEVTFLTAPWT